MNGNLVGATAPAPELQKVYYYHRHARRAYRRGYYGGYYGGYNPGYGGRAEPFSERMIQLIRWPTERGGFPYEHVSWQNDGFAAPS
jgi:hypothetical protein